MFMQSNLAPRKGWCTKLTSVNEDIIAQDKLVEHPFLTWYMINAKGGLIVDLLAVANDKAIIQNCKMWMKIAKTTVTTK